MKPLSDIHEFVHDMRQVSACYNSPHIAKNVHELRHKRFGQNCDHVRVYTTLVRVLRNVYENLTTILRHIYEFLQVCNGSARPLASLYDLVRYTTICYDIYTRLVR